MGSLRQVKAELSMMALDLSSISPLTPKFSSNRLTIGLVFIREYEGQWNDDLRHGIGSLTFASGAQVTDGEWAQGVPQFCANCGKSEVTTTCDGCLRARYCSRKCLEEDYPLHKRECTALADL